MSHRDRSHVTLYHGAAGSTVTTIRSEGLKFPEDGEGLLMCKTSEEAKRIALSMAAWLANEGIVAVDEIAIVAATVKRSRLDPEPALAEAYWLRGSVRPANLKVLQMLRRECRDPG